MDSLARVSRPAPPVSLPDLDGKIHSLSEQLGRIVVLNFWSSECPWAQRVDGSLKALRAAWSEDIVYWPIVSNSNESRDLIAAAAARQDLPLVLLDRDQSIADKYGAATTPHFFVIDRDGVLQYSGAYDDVTFHQKAPTRSYLQEAVVALRTGRQPDPAETPPYGCSLVRHSLS
jgi:peroxiredoxin